MFRFFVPSYLAWLPFIQKPIDEVGKYVDEIILSRKNSKEEHYDLLSLMLADRSDNMKVTTDELKSNSYVFLLAG